MAEGPCRAVPCRAAISHGERLLSARARDSPATGHGPVFGVRTRWHRAAGRSRPARPVHGSPEPGRGTGGSPGRRNGEPGRSGAGGRMAVPQPLNAACPQGGAGFQGSFTAPAGLRPAPHRSRLRGRARGAHPSLGPPRLGSARLGLPAWRRCGARPGAARPVPVQPGPVQPGPSRCSPAPPVPARPVPARPSPAGPGPARRGR